MAEELLSEKLEEAKILMGESIDHLKEQLMKIRTGKANPAMLNGIMVDYYGTPTKLNQVANVGTSDSRTLTIQPWEKSMLGPIEKSIFEANLGLTPMNDGEMVRINIPPLTEERRRELAKKVKEEGENAKISIRGSRQKGMDAIKAEVKSGYPEDAGKRLEGEMEGTTKSFYEQVDKLVNAKSEEVLTL